MKTKITWITSDSFIDCDINIIKDLKNVYDITWIVLLPRRGGRFKREDFENDSEFNDINLEIIILEFSLRKPNSYGFWFKFARKINKINSQVIYYNGDISLFNLIFIWKMDKSKLIVTIHEGKITTNNIVQLLMINSARRLSIPFIKYINCFSSSQASFFKEKFKNNKVFIIPLALKDFGVSKKDRLTEYIVFFNFGTILPKKNIDLLIDAACNIYEKGYRGFKVGIFGASSEWEFYEERIRYPDIFICDIRLIDNDEIKDLFAEYHYLVLPYKVASQSGPLKIAFNYNVPTIVSDQPGFTEEVIDGVNGFIFKTEDVNSLENVMIKLIDNHHEYENIRTNMKNHIQSIYSNKAINAKYIDMFDKVIEA